jgi:hypothetical protein
VGKRAATAVRTGLCVPQGRWTSPVSILSSSKEEDHARCVGRTTAPGLIWESQFPRFGSWKVLPKRLMATSSEGPSSGDSAKPPSSPSSTGENPAGQQEKKQPFSSSFTTVSLKHPATSSSFNAAAGKGQWSAASLGSRVGMMGMNAGRGTNLGIPSTGMGPPSDAPQQNYDPVSMSSVQSTCAKNGFHQADPCFISMYVQVLLEKLGISHVPAWRIATVLQADEVTLEEIAEHVDLGLHIPDDGVSL